MDQSYTSKYVNRETCIMHETGLHLKKCLYSRVKGNAPWNMFPQANEVTLFDILEEKRLTWSDSILRSSLLFRLYWFYTKICEPAALMSFNFELGQGSPMFRVPEANQYLICLCGGIVLVRVVMFLSWIVSSFPLNSLIRLQLRPKQVLTATVV